jgi:hypothetical protein
MGGIWHCWGNNGQGKSTGALMFTYHRIMRGGDGRIPILIELRGKSPATLQPEELLSAWAHAYSINPKAVMCLHEAGRLLLIFDGFDEMAEAATVEARINHFAALWRFDHPLAKLIFTGRPNFFLKGEQRRALKVERSVAVGSYCDALRLDFFDEARMRECLRSFDAEVCDEVLALARSDERFRDVASRPSLLYQVAVLWRTAEFQAGKDMMTSAAVLGLFIRHLYRRQTEKARNSPTTFMVLNEDERAYFMDGVAAYMAAKNLPNQITSEAFAAVVNRLYQAYPDAAAGSDERVWTESFKLRLADHPSLAEEVITDVRTYGLLADDPSRPGALRFPHKSLLEVLQAQCAARSFLRRPDPLMRAIIEATEFRGADALKYQAILLLCADIVSYDVPDSYRRLSSSFDIANKVCNKEFVGLQLRSSLCIVADSMSGALYVHLFKMFLIIGSITVIGSAFGDGYIIKKAANLFVLTAIISLGVILISAVFDSFVRSSHLFIVIPVAMAILYRRRIGIAEMCDVFGTWTTRRLLRALERQGYGGLADAIRATPPRAQGGETVPVTSATP